MGAKAVKTFLAAPMVRENALLLLFAFHQPPRHLYKL